MYTLSNFYLYLKLGIWLTGNVEGLGLVQQVDIYSNGLTNKGFIPLNQPDEYRRNEIIKTELQAGLYLLDVYPLNIQQTSRYNNKYKIYNYLIVISVCRLNVLFEECIYYLKVTNYQSLEQFKKTINDGVQLGKSNWSPIKSRRRSSRFDPSPLNSIVRKY